LGDLLELEADDAVAALELAMTVQEHGLVHLHAHFASVATAVARVAAAITGIGYSFTAHAKDIFHESVDPVALERRLADATSVVTVSDYNLAHLQRTFGGAADRVHRVYNGLDLSRFGYRAPSTGTGWWSAWAAWWRRRASGTCSTPSLTWPPKVARSGWTWWAPVSRRPPCGSRSPCSVCTSTCACSVRCPSTGCGRWSRTPERSPHPVWWARTATGTGCPPSCWRRWPWAPRAWPPRSPGSPRCCSTSGPVCWSRRGTTSPWP